MDFHMKDMIKGNIRIKHKLALVFIIFVTGLMETGSVLGKETDYEAYSNLNTVALWLFDEPNQPGIILEDASRNQYNLRLHEAGRLIPGKFGNALEVLPENRFQTAAEFECTSRVIFNTTETIESIILS